MSRNDTKGSASTGSDSGLLRVLKAIWRVFEIGHRFEALVGLFFLGALALGFINETHGLILIPIAVAIGLWIWWRRRRPGPPEIRW